MVLKVVLRSLFFPLWLAGETWYSWWARNPRRTSKINFSLLNSCKSDCLSIYKTGIRLEDFFYCSFQGVRGPVGETGFPGSEGPPGVPVRNHTLSCPILMHCYTTLCNSVFPYLGIWCTFFYHAVLDLNQVC